VTGETPEWLLWVQVGLLVFVMLLPGLKPLTIWRPGFNRAFNSKVRLRGLAAIG
jgi:hypothetical protein